MQFFVFPKSALFIPEQYGREHSGMPIFAYRIVENIPPAEAVANLRKLVGWREVDEQSIAKGFVNSLYAVFVETAEEVIGTVMLKF